MRNLRENPIRKKNQEDKLVQMPQLDLAKAALEEVKEVTKERVTLPPLTWVSKGSESDSEGVSSTSFSRFLGSFLQKRSLDELRGNRSSCHYLLCPPSFRLHPTSVPPPTLPLSVPSTRLRSEYPQAPIKKFLFINVLHEQQYLIEVNLELQEQHQEWTWAEE
ncbi:hypothetical protein BDP27DRAFT_1367671 [Rhodocollybia butyracea]|uniref:Uncharacterized protein n=1 Tax=Rhodocollybia butyracea TaxID=206335 RepID=A0A9P5U2G5_9AGAR|nr:hypothetical protein BDP27DRAFT_1367671 [Rhodocollybia butyracea]